MEEHIVKDIQPRQINPHLARRVQEELGENVYLCYQCVKCTSGCPVAAYFDLQPNQIMRALQLGQQDLALGSETPWLCASCQTCTTRCPQGLDIAGIMDFLTREAKEQGYPAPIQEVDVFNQAFMREVNLWGRSYELGMMAEMKLRNPSHLFDDLDFYAKMLQKRKVSFLPTPARPPRHPKPLADAPNSVAYYPGCSLHSTGKEFDSSAYAVCEALDIQLIEPRGWMCCGGSAAHRLDPDAALKLPMRNLALIEQNGFTEVTMPCAACFNRHKAAQFEIRHHEERLEFVSSELQYDYQDKVKVSSLVEAIHRHTGSDGLAAKVETPLKGLRIVCYYGCLLTRPPESTEVANYENPTEMDDLLGALGAEVFDWSYKTSCCGAAHSITRPDIVLDLSRSLLEQAKAVGADVVAVACPLCHTNLDGRQFQMKLENPIPILYFTQLMAVALDLPAKKAALHKNLIDPRPLLNEKGFL